MDEMADHAKETFDKAMNRALTLYRMHHALVNMRKRGIRSDWLRKFCEFMNWKKDAATDRVDSRDAVIVLKSGSGVSRGDFAKAEISNLLRGSLIAAVSAMDAYFHEKIISHVASKARSSKNIPPKLKEWRITLGDFISAERYVRRGHVITKATKRRLSYQSLQRPEQIADGLSLIGVRKFWKKIARRMRKRADIIKGELDKIIDRRNRIAHEGDLSRSRKFGLRSREIEPAYVHISIDFLKKLVTTSEKEINNQLK